MGNNLKDDFKLIFCAFLLIILSPIGLIAALMFKKSWERRAGEDFLKINPSLNFNINEINFSSEPFVFLEINNVKVNYWTTVNEIESYVSTQALNDEMKSLLIELNIKESEFLDNWSRVVEFFKKHENNDGSSLVIKYNSSLNDLQVRYSWWSLIFLFPILKIRHGVEKWGSK